MVISNYTLACRCTQEVNFTIIRTPFWCILPKKISLQFVCDTGVYAQSYRYPVRYLFLPQFARTFARLSRAQRLSGRSCTFFSEKRTAFTRKNPEFHISKVHIPVFPSSAALCAECVAIGAFSRSARIFCIDLRFIHLPAAVLPLLSNQLTRAFFQNIGTGIPIRKNAL